MTPETAIIAASGVGSVGAITAAGIAAWASVAAKRDSRETVRLLRPNGGIESSEASLGDILQDTHKLARSADSKAGQALAEAKDACKKAEKASITAETTFDLLTDHVKEQQGRRRAGDIDPAIGGTD